MKKLVNGVEVEMTPAEQAELEAARYGTLQQAQARMREKLARRCALAEASGFAHNGKRWESSASVVGRTAMMSQLEGEPGPFSIDVETESGELVSMNVAAYQAYRKALAGHYKACNARRSALLAQINAATTPQQALAIDVRQGWPS